MAFLHDRLYEFNVAATGIDDGETFTFLRHGDDESIVAGVHGWTWGRSAWIDVMWVAEHLRSTGTGSALLGAAESRARERDCRQLALATHTFQARTFYERHGFAVVSYLDEHPAGHGQFVMRKTLP